MASTTALGSQAAAADRHATYKKARLFFVSCLALATTGIMTSLRANSATEIQQLFLDPIDKAHSAAMIANVLAVPFAGYALTIALASPLLDYLSMGLFLRLAAIGMSIGSLIMVFTGHFATGAGAYNVLWTGALVAGLGWGLVEAVINPLIATLYPDEKAAKLNALHAWWPGGLALGGLFGVFLTNAGLTWQFKLGFILIPAIAVIVLSFGIKFPPTERQAAGVTFGEMFRELANPLFLVLFCSMFMTAASELAPGQWVDFALSKVVHMPGILLLVYVSVLMFVMRHFAGPLVHKLSSIGLLWFSALLAAFGLFFLSMANSPVTALLAATVWGTGVCYMWPTMLATASERFPRGGALLMGLMGTAGMLSIQFVLPWMGQIYDTTKVQVAGGQAAFDALAGVDLDRVQTIAAQTSFRDVAAVPAILLIVFGAIWLRDRSQGGFRGEKIS